MHRLTFVAALGLLALSCGEKKPAESAKTHDDDLAATTTASEADAGAAEAPPPEKKDICIGFDIANLEDLLVKSDCEVANGRPDLLENTDLEGKLEVTVSASPTKVAPGAKADLQVTFTNKTQAPLPLSFRIDPVARFELETYDAKKKRADMPAGNPPSPPKGHSAPPPGEGKVARVTIAPSGFARVRIPWQASRMKWAPDQVRGTAVEKGFPRKPAGALPRGTYNVKVVTPLIGVLEGSDHEVSAPRTDVEVGG